MYIRVLLAEIYSKHIVIYAESKKLITIGVGATACDGGGNDHAADDKHMGSNKAHATD